MQMRDRLGAIDDDTRYSALFAARGLPANDEKADSHCLGCGNIGSRFLVCCWIFGAVYARKFPLAVFLVVLLGMFCAWQVFLFFLEEKRKLH